MKPSKPSFAILPYLLAFPVVLMPACMNNSMFSEGEKKPIITDVKSGDFKIKINARGKVIANREVQVSSKASGEIVELPFEAGAVVKTGDLLVRLDPDDEQRNVRNMEFEVKSAESRLEKTKNELTLGRSSLEKSGSDASAQLQYAAAKLADAEAKHKRMEKLFADKMIPKEDLETSRTAFEQAKSDNARAIATHKDTRSLDRMVATREQDIKLAEVDLGRAQVALEQSKERLAETRVLATMDGTITDKKVEKGQVISSAMTTVGGGTVLLTLADLTKLFIVAEVDEADVGGIQLKQKASIAADAFPDTKFAGSVYHIAPIGVEKNGVVTFNVKVEVEGEGIKKLRPGMTADVEITTGEAANTLWAQSGAVQEEEEEGKEGVWKKFVEVVTSPIPDEKDKKEAKKSFWSKKPPLKVETKKVPVETGISDGLYTELKNGVSAGEKLLVPQLDLKKANGQ